MPVQFNDASVERVRNTLQGKCVLVLPTSGPAPVRELVMRHGLGCLRVHVDDAPRAVICFGSLERLKGVCTLVQKSDVLDHGPTLIDAPGGDGWNPRDVVALLGAEPLQQGVVMFTAGSSFFARPARDF